MVGEVEAAPVSEWAEGLDEVHQRITPRFARPEMRRRSRQYLEGLLASVERKNSWQMAEQGGERTPYGIQRLLSSARWDAEAVRDDLRAYVVEHLGDAGGVLILDETGFLKKGTKSVGVQRQYSGTAGRIENCQIGVFVGYASSKGRAFVDRALYLPQGWAEDAARRDEAGVPDTVRFATKVQLGRQMLRRALDTGVPAAWVTGDEVYGRTWRLRHELEERDQGYVLAVGADQAVWESLRQRRVKHLATELPEAAWQRLSVGEGAKGPRLYDWACQPLTGSVPPGWGRWLLVRRSVTDPEEIAYYLAAGPKETPWQTLAWVAGQRWAIEMSLEEAKSLTGLDEYEVRRWEGWYRHITLSLLAHAFLAVTRAKAQTPKGAMKRACR